MWCRPHINMGRSEDHNGYVLESWPVMMDKLWLIGRVQSFHGRTRWKLFHLSTTREPQLSPVTILQPRLFIMEVMGQGTIRDIVVEVQI
jgi:hypothetical protein